MRYDGILAEGPFYGAHSNKFRLGDYVFVAVEDKNDDYRSSLEELVVGPVKAGNLFGFFQQPIAEVFLVRIREQEHNGYSGTHLDGWVVVDKEDGHVWLRVGTTNWDDYYPCFTFEYRAKAPTD